MVSRDYDGEGHYLSNLTIPAVNLTLNDTIISCLVNTSVIIHYHLTVGESREGGGGDSLGMTLSWIRWNVQSVY